MKRVIILGIITLGLFLYILLYERHQPTTDEAKELEQKVLHMKEEAILQLRYRGDTHQWTLEKAGDEWTLKEPKELPVEETQVNSLVNQIVNLKKERVLEKVSNLEAYGLKKPRAKLIIKTKEDQRTLLIGNDIPATSNLALQVLGDPRVFIVPQNFYSTINKSVKDLRKKQILEVNTNDIYGLLVQKRDKTYEFQKKKGNWYLIKPWKDRANRQKVEDILFGLSGLRAKDFLDDLDEATLAFHGLGHPMYRLAIYAKDGKPLGELSIGRTPKDQKNQFSVLYGKQGFLCDHYLWERLQFKEGELKDPHLLAFERWDVQKAEFTVKGKRHTLKRKKDTYEWLWDGKVLEETKPVDDLLQALGDLEVKERISEKPKKKLVELTIHWDEKEDYTISATLYEKAGKVEDREGYFSLEPEKVQDILKKIEALTK